jgi:hypothetical protein
MDTHDFGSKGRLQGLGVPG